MTKQEYLAQLVRQLWPENGVEFLSAVVASLAPEQHLDTLIQLLEIETL